MVSGLTKNESKDLMNKYLSTPLPMSPGTWYGTMGGWPDAHSNCTLFSQWFLKNYTKGNVSLAMPSGYGYEIVDKFIAVNGGKFSKSGTPQAISLFSISPNNGTYGTEFAGHTGIVLGIDGDTVITGEANYGAPYGGLDADHSKNGTVVMSRSLSTFNSSTGVTFVHLETTLDDNDKKKEEEEEMITISAPQRGIALMQGGVFLSFLDSKDAQNAWNAGIKNVELATKTFDLWQKESRTVKS